MKSAIVQVLVGVFALVGLGVGVYYMVMQYFPEKKSTRAPQLTPEEAAKIEGWEEREAREAREREAEISLLRLHDRYSRELIAPHVHDLLVDRHDFASVQSLLEGLRDAAITPMERYHYSETLEQTGSVCDEHNFETIFLVLEEWVALEPENHYPLIARAYACMSERERIQSNRTWPQISEDDRIAMTYLVDHAWLDLQKARELAPEDVEVYAALIKAAALTERGTDAMYEYYEAAQARDPHHFRTLAVMSTYVQPQWYGTIDDLIAVREDIRAAQAEFPYLYVLERYATYYIEQDDNWYGKELLRAGVDAYDRQLALTPDDTMTLGHAAYYAYYSGDLLKAATHFEALGMRYPAQTDFQSLYEYHTARLDAYLRGSQLAEVKGTPREGALLHQALLTEPTNGKVTTAYLNYLVGAKNDEEATAFFATMQDPYIMTGDPGSPPRPEYIEALALAQTVFWTTGVTGKDGDLERLEPAMELDPDNAFVHLMLAEHYIMNKTYRKARKLLERARELDPDYLPALHIMGWLNYHQKRWDEGIAYAEQLLGAEPCFYVEANVEDAKEIIELCKKKRAKEAEAG